MHARDKAILYAKEIEDKRGEQKSMAPAQTILAYAVAHFAKLSALNGLKTNWTYSNRHLESMAMQMRNQGCIVNNKYTNDLDGMSISEAACEVFEGYQREYEARIAIKEYGLQEAIEKIGTYALEVYYYDA